MLIKLLNISEIDVSDEIVQENLAHRLINFVSSKNSGNILAKIVTDLYRFACRTHDEALGYLVKQFADAMLIVISDKADNSPGMQNVLAVIALELDAIEGGDFDADTPNQRKRR